MHFFCTVPRPYFLGRALIWPGYFGEHILGHFGLHPSSLSKSAGFVFLSGKASLVSISAAILLLRSWHVYFLLEFEFRGKRNFVGAIRTTTTNYRVSFTDLYLVFPRNFRIVIFPHTTRTVLWYYHRAWVTCAEIYKKALEWSWT